MPNSNGGSTKIGSGTTGRVQNRSTVSTTSSQNVNNHAQNSGKIANNFSSNVNPNAEKNLSNEAETKSASGGNFWPNVINKLKEERKAMLFSNLNNTSAVMLDDMTVGIQFANGLNSFGRAVIERPENMNELKRLVSMECGKDMRIKILDRQENKKELNSENKLDLGININYID